MHQRAAAAPRDAPLEEQRDVEHHERIAALDRRLRAAHHLADHGCVDDLPEPRTGLLVPEDDRAERLAIEGAVGRQDRSTEGVGEGGEHRLTRRLQLVHDRVGVDRRRTELRQHRASRCSCPFRCRP